MLGVYFSGTGNSKYCVQIFLDSFSTTVKAFSIEDDETIEQIMKAEEIVISYPVYYSNIPKILYDYIQRNQTIWKGKKVFVMATMALFSGDGSGKLARMLEHYGAVIIGGLHVIMPDCIADERVLKYSKQKNKQILLKAEEKIRKSVVNYNNGIPQREGLGFLNHMAGLFGQRLFFYNKTRRYTDKLKFDLGKCIGCGLCATLCPMDNIEIKENFPITKGECTTCYRCVNQCPRQAIVILVKKVVAQYKIREYLSFTDSK